MEDGFCMSVEQDALNAEGLSSDKVAQIRGKITVYVVLACLLTSSGSFVMGYDAYINGGVEAFPDFLNLWFPAVINTQAARSKYCYYNDQGIQWFTSSAFLGGIVSALFAMYFIRRFGRIRIILFCSFFFVIGLVLISAAQAKAMLFTGRVLLGATAAFSNTAIQVFCVEMAPPQHRARLGVIFQVGIALGGVIAPLVNAGTKYIHPWGWRLSYALALIPALMLMLGGFILPDTPNSLVLRGKNTEARRVLERIRGTRRVELEFETIKAAAAESLENLSLTTSFTTILQRRYRPYLYLSASSSLFQIWTGVNFIGFFGPQLLVALGLDPDMVLWLNFAGAPIGLAGVLVAMWLTDKIGRKASLIYPTMVMFVSFVVIALVLAIAGTDKVWVGWLSLVIVWVFNFFFNIGWGATATLYPAEICPLEVRPAGQATATFVQNIFNFVVAQTSLSQLCAMRWGIFVFLAGLLLIMGVCVELFYVESARVPIELIPDLFDKHWFWKRYTKDEPSWHDLNGSTYGGSQEQLAAGCRDPLSS